MSRLAAAALLIGGSMLGGNAASSQSKPIMLHDGFRIGCVEQAPLFGGSAAAFARAGVKEVGVDDGVHRFQGSGITAAVKPLDVRPPDRALCKVTDTGYSAGLDPLELRAATISVLGGPDVQSCSSTLVILNVPNCTLGWQHDDGCVQMVSIHGTRLAASLTFWPGKECPASGLPDG